MIPGPALRPGWERTLRYAVPFALTVKRLGEIVSQRAAERLGATFGSTTTRPFGLIV